MTDPELIEKWSRIEAELHSALESVRSDLADDEAGLIVEYLDHNELGLALELLADSLVASGVTVPRTTLDQLHRAYEEMGAPPSDSWEKFTRCFGDIAEL